MTNGEFPMCNIRLNYIPNECPECHWSTLFSIKTESEYYRLQCEGCGLLIACPEK